MRAEQAVRARLAALPALVAITGPRIYLLKLPQTVVYPAVRVQLIDRRERAHLRGPAGTPSVRVQIDAFDMEDSGSNPYTNVASMIAAIEGDGLGPGASGLKGFKGTIGGFEVLGCFLLDERSPEYLPDEHRVVQMSQDYAIHYRV